MDSKRLAQIGAAVFVGLALAMTLVQLREKPDAPQHSSLAVEAKRADPLASQLRACSEMGEQALSSSACRAAWAEKRRRFFGVAHPDAYGEPTMATAPDLAGAHPNASGSD